MVTGSWLLTEAVRSLVPELFYRTSGLGLVVLSEVLVSITLSGRVSSLEVSESGLFSTRVG